MKLLIEKELCLTESDTKTSVSIPFTVPGNTEKLFITYSYSPKLLEDEEKAKRLIKENILRDAPEDAEAYTDYGRFMPLKNLITLSLNSPEGYVGAAHRQDSEQHHEICEDFASPGFIKCKPEKGEWVLSLDIHAIVTDNVICKLKIEAEEEEI